jgi:hypothetical protein
MALPCRPAECCGIAEVEPVPTRFFVAPAANGGGVIPRLEVPVANPTRSGRPVLHYRRPVTGAAVGPLAIQPHTDALSCARTRVEPPLPVPAATCGDPERPMSRTEQDESVGCPGGPGVAAPTQPRSTSGTTSRPTDCESESPKSPRPPTPSFELAGSGARRGRPNPKAPLPPCRDALPRTPGGREGRVLAPTRAVL